VVAQLLPSDLLRLHRGGVQFSKIAIDTETSGLYPDDGGRVAVVSVAWQTAPSWNGWDVFQLWANEGRLILREETIAEGYTAWVASVAWAFDQGIDGKVDHSHGQIGLWEDVNNLPVEEWNALCDLLTLNWLIMHNMLFDCIAMSAGVRHWPGNGIILDAEVQWDTLTVAQKLWPKYPADLDSIGERLFDAGKKNQDILKKWLKKNKKPVGRFDLVPWAIMNEYAGRDPRLTLMTYLRQVYEIHKDNLGSWLGDAKAVERAINRWLEIIRVCIRMERKGVPYDQVASVMAGDEGMRRAEKISARLPFQPPTADRAKDYWFGEGGGSLGLIPYETSPKTGEPSLTAEVVQRMVVDEVPGADVWAEYRKVQTAVSMWYHGYAEKVGADGRLRTRFRPGGTRSTRFSVERVNMQAIPADYRLSGFDSLAGLPTPRQLIVAAVQAGWRIYELDLAQAELRVGALYSKCTPMLEMMERGEDLHNYTTIELFKIKPEEADWSKMRQVGKRANFSLGFDSGAETFRNMVSKETGIRLSLQESSKIVRDWRGLYPEWHEAVIHHMEIVKQRQRRNGIGWIECKNNERRWWQRFEDPHKAFNQRVQTSLAQFGVDWMLMSDEYLREEAPEVEEQGGGIVLTIHDSQVLLLPESRGQELAEACAGFAVKLWSNWFPGIWGGSEAKAWKAAA
jgi:DNA polymerase I-like protein with 3'-5' exonuclease and polymerase domains